MNLSVVVPLHNEEANIERLLATTLTSLQRNPLVERFELICVDDGSTDGTAALLAPARGESVVVVSLPRRSGQSAALARGIGAARYEIIARMDGDLQTSPEDFDQLLPWLGRGFDCVHGVRVDRQDPWLRRWSSRVANRFRRWVLGDPFEDISCPLSVFRRDCVAEITLFTPFHRYLPYLVAMQGYTVKQVPVRHFPRVAGSAKYGISNRLLAGLVSVFVVRWLSRHYLPRRSGGHDGHEA